MPFAAVVDASVLVSAFLFPQSIPGVVVRLAESRQFALHLSPILLDETRDSLASPRLRQSYGHDQKAVSDWVSGLRDIGAVFLGPLPDIGPACRDPNDDHVLAAAIAVEADFIVTGDKDLLALGHFQTVRIVTPRRFLFELSSDKQ